MHLLIVEDDLDLGQALLAALQGEGFTCVWIRRLADVPARPQPEVDAALLDLTLPDGEGLALLRRWRASGVTTPVLVITARSALDDRLAGLDSGADDYIIKPFAMAELISRLWAVHRRTVQQASAVWSFNALAIEPRAHRATLAGQPLDLSAREFHLLVELARAPGEVVSKGILGEKLEPSGDPVDPATIEVHVSNLRRKIGAARVRTVRGVGYQFVP
ncbi:response regulator transcription factor [Rhizobacter sp. Root1221]|uniref:response regulator n=1 Tax=Rhizobacter sp. Root1221 TaxID=1736433 RepID=UPI0006FCBDFB|nr:response regulator transcription factor [Rhizobacter sp. Root1221]KQW01228.1 two-component system response regulator [Rhizobacter sp. Root1221]